MNKKTFQPIQAGYVAFNGHVFSASDAAWYNMEAERAHHFPCEEYSNAAHKAFATIIQGSKR